MSSITLLRRGGDGLRFRRMIRCDRRGSDALRICIGFAVFLGPEILSGVADGRNIEAWLQWSTRFCFRVVSGCNSMGRSESRNQRGFTAFGSYYGWWLEPVGLQRAEGTQGATRIQDGLC